MREQRKKERKKGEKKERKGESRGTRASGISKSWVERRLF